MVIFNGSFASDVLIGIRRIVNNNVKTIVKYIINKYFFIGEQIIIINIIENATVIKLTKYKPNDGYSSSNSVPVWLAPAKSHGKPPNILDLIISINTHIEGTIAG